MATHKRSAAFWFIVTFLFASLVFLLAGQTMAVFDYGLTVRLGLQESEESVSRFGVEVNRAFGAGDSIVYVPLIILSLIGLFLKKRWSLLTTAAVMGISAYWATTVVFMLLFLEGVSGYQFTPGVEYWLVTGAYIACGVLGLSYLAINSNKIIE